MKKALVVKSQFQGRSVGHVERVADASQIDPLNGNFYDRMEKVEVPVELENVDPKALKGVLVPAAAEYWSKEGEANSSTEPDPIDGWTYNPPVPEHWEVQQGDNYVAYDKEKRIGDKYQTLNDEVLAEMQQVYGTTNPDSAVANYLTWLAMKANPGAFSGAGLKARFDVVGFTIGDALDDNAKVTDYATKCLDNADTYAVYREQKILAYGADKAAIEAE